MTEGLKFGFYNSKSDSKREYSAKDFAEMFMGVITEGVLPSGGDKFRVRSINDGMKIEVGIGRAWLKNTYSYLPSPINFELELGDSQYPRYDTVVLQIGCSENIRENNIIIKTGIPSEIPVPPELEGDPTIEGLNIYEYPLACIYVPFNASDLSEAIITNLSGLEDSDLYESKYLTGTSEVVSVSEIGKTIIDVSINEWMERDDGAGVYYIKDIYVGSKIAPYAIANFDLFTNPPSSENTINSIHAQEEAFSQCFKFDVYDNIIRIYSYSIPEVNYKIRATGKGVLNI